MDAQCTPGAQREGHHAQIKVVEYSGDIALKIFPWEHRSQPGESLGTLLKKVPTLLYAGSGPLFAMDWSPLGWVVSEGRVVSPIDCKTHRSPSGNYGVLNGIFQRRKTGLNYEYSVTLSDKICLEHQEKNGLKVDFAIQSGPAAIVEGKLILPQDYNQAISERGGFKISTLYRSFIGISKSGLPTVVEVYGPIGHYCFAKYMHKKGFIGLLHRDSSGTDAWFRDRVGSTKLETYPKENPSRSVSMVLTIAEAR